VIVRPTSAGRAAWDRYVHEGMTREQHLLAPLSASELEQLNRLLRKVVLALDEL
jgi:DNA-binding MarR family transcriptional regulator